MIIHTLWHAGYDGDVPWLIDAIDEYTVDNNGAFPPEYLKKRADPIIRELMIDVPEKAVRGLFDPPVVKGVVKSEPVERCAECSNRLDAGEQHRSGLGRICDRCARGRFPPGSEGS